MDITPFGARLVHESIKVVPPTSSIHFVAPFPSVRFITCSLREPESIMTSVAPAVLTVEAFFSERVVDIILAQLNREDLAREAAAKPTLVVPPRISRVSSEFNRRDCSNAPQARK